MLLERFDLYISSGLSVDQTLRIIRGDLGSRQAACVTIILSSVEAGGKLSGALKQYVGLRESISSLIEHGESSGELASALHAAKTLLEREDELVKKCLSAMIYPSVIGLMAIVLTLGLIRGVMPQIIPMLRGLHVQLPLLTRVVMMVSEGLLSYGLFICGGCIFLGIVVILIYRKYPAIAELSHRLILHIPIVGRLISQYSLTIFLHSCGLLIESGVSTSQAYSNTVRTVTFRPLRAMLEPGTISIQRGQPIGRCLVGKYVPSYVGSLLKAGEASGSLGASIIHCANIIDRDIENILKRLTALIEPLMMAGMGTIVGAIALSIMMPIYDISKVLQK